jgi:CheY-like chemotaxis protein
MPQTCLIAAHDPWFIQLLRIYSEESSFFVVQVYEGQDVLPMALQVHPAAVIMQADLPGKLKGREVLRALHADPQVQHVPVLVFSWQGHSADSDVKVDWLKEGAAAHLQEPVTFESFQDALHKAGVGLTALEQRAAVEQRAALEQRASARPAESASNIDPTDDQPPA